MRNKKARREIKELCYKLRMPKSREEQSDNTKSYELIKQFKTLYADCKPDKTYDNAHTDYYYYFFFRQLFPIWEALNKKDYVLALHEIETLTAYNNIFQLRIKTALGDLLNKYIS